MSDIVGTGTLDPRARILHVLTHSSGPIAEVARRAVADHLGRGYHVAVAARREVFDDLDLPRNPRLVHIETPARDLPGLSDPSAAFTLHKYYRHVDVVHAHGLKAGALAALGTTGLPVRMRPAIVTTVGRLGADSTIEKSQRALVARTSTVVLGTTDPVCEAFTDSVEHVRRAGLYSADVAEVPAPSTSRAGVRKRLAVPSGAFLVASPARLEDSPAASAVVAAALGTPKHRADRRWTFALTGGGPLAGTIDADLTGAHPWLHVVGGDAGRDTVAAADLVLVTERLGHVDAETIMQWGKPVIAVGGDELGRLWGSSVPVVAPGDEAGLGRAISEFVDSPVARVSAGFGTRRRVVPEEDTARIPQDLLEMYHLALESITTVTDH